MSGPGGRAARGAVRGPTGPAPRPRVTPERVLLTAEELADEVGLARLTLAEVAARLGIRLPSVYKHVAGLDVLHRELAVRAKTDLAEAMAAAAVGRSGEDALRAVATAFRTWATAHPGRYPATVRSGDPDDELEQAAGASAAGVVFDVLRPWGLQGDDLVHATRVLRAALHGFVSLEQGEGFGLPADVDTSFDRLVDTLVAALHATDSPPTT